MNIKDSVILKNKSFMKLWSSYTISKFGSSLSFFAIMVYIYSKTGRAVDVGFYTLAGAVASIVSGPFIGTLVDKYNKKRLMIISNIINAILIAGVIFVKNYYEIYIITFLMTIAGNLSVSSRMSVMPEITSEKDLVAANSFISVSSFTINILGPVAAGMLVAYVGSYITFVLDSISYILGAVIIYFIGLSPTAVVKNKEKNYLADLSKGIKYIFTNETLKFYGILGIFYRIFLGMILHLMLAFVTKYLHGSTGDYGIIMSMAGVGGIIGSYCAKVLNNKFAINDIFGYGLILLGFGYILFSLNSLFALSIVLYLLINVVLYSTIINIHVNVQKITPKDIIGHVFASVGTIFSPFSLISMGLGSVLADIIGVQRIILISAVLYFALSVFVVNIQRKKLRSAHPSTINAVVANKIAKEKVK